MESPDLLCFNGINGASGAYHLPPMAPEQLVNMVKGESPADKSVVQVGRSLLEKDGHYGVTEGLDAADLLDAGWGVIFPHDTDGGVIEALQPLLRLRREQAGERFRIYHGSDGYMPEETKSQFLARHGVGPGPAQPETVPYYLMIAASPQTIPFSFQFQLDVQYGVGRLCFSTLDEYAAYAQTVVASETGSLSCSRNFHLLGVSNPDDRATHLSLEGLVQPLTKNLGQAFPDWQVTPFLEEEANKSRLLSLFSGKERSALLFTASHGMSFPHGDSRQFGHQGALLCGEWPGPKQWKGAIPQDFYVAGDDLTDEAGPGGLISFHHACYGAGVPLYDDFSRASYRAREALAPYPFISGLPQRLLAHPKGGALAVVGHVDRAWGYSFDWPGSGSQTAVFESALTRILKGKPVGMALDFFNERYAELAAELTTVLDGLEFGKKPNYKELVASWTAHNDARDYVLLGDPAVRLPLDDQQPQRSVPIELTRPAPPPTPHDPVKVTPVSAPPPAAAPVPVAPVQAVPRKSASTGQAVSDLVADLIAKLNTAMKALDQIEVRTCLVNPEKADTAGLTTRISANGDFLQILADTEEPANEKLIFKHNEAVRLASENRATTLRAIGDVLARLMLKSNKDGGPEHDS